MTVGRREVREEGSKMRQGERNGERKGGRKGRRKGGRKEGRNEEIERERMTMCSDLAGSKLHTV